MKPWEVWGTGYCDVGLKLRKRPFIQRSSIPHLSNLGSCLHVVFASCDLYYLITKNKKSPHIILDQPRHILALWARQLQSLKAETLDGVGRGRGRGGSHLVLQLG